MNRIERIAPLLEALSDETFEDFLAAAAHAAATSTIYATLSETEKAEIDEAIASLDKGEGIAYETFKANRDAKLKAALE